MIYDNEINLSIFLVGLFFVYICTMKKLQVIQISLEERLMATRPNVYRNKKKYQRKTKHKNNGKL